MSNITRIGKINFANVWPVFYRFPAGPFASESIVYEMTPAQLNRAILNDEIDMGFISSYAYLQNEELFELIPNLSISAHGTVSSILLFHDCPLEQLYSGRIALADTSATSVHLLKILLEQYGAGSPQYVVSKPDLKLMFDECKAEGALLIGDDAIRASFQAPTRYVTDLGEWWHRVTGHSMTYAVWAVRKSYAERNREKLVDITEQLSQSLQLGLRQIETLIRQATLTIGGDEMFWRRYYRQLCYTFGVIEQQGLQAYHEALQVKS